MARLGIDGVTATILGLAGAVTLFAAALAFAPEQPYAVLDETETMVEEVSQPDVPTLPTVAERAEIVARPIFNADRRPDPPPAPPAPVVEAPATPPEVRQTAPLRLELVGVAISGDERVALLREDGGDILRLRPGDRVGDWVVVSVEQKDVVFRAGEKIQTIGFRDRRGRR